MLTSETPRPVVAVIGALYPVARRGLRADLEAAIRLGLAPRPVCTAIAMATSRRVSDFVEVPEDAVRSQLEHIAGESPPSGVKLGVLAQHGTAAVALDWARERAVPCVLDLHVSGPAGETVLSRRGLDEVMQRLNVPEVVLVDRTDAELLSGGEISSLDDVQVAAQRIVRRGARAVLVKAGRIPHRHFGTEVAPYAADLLYDGREFALFEAPWIEGVSSDGASSLHALALLAALVRGESLEEAVRFAKGEVSDDLRGRVHVGAEPDGR